MRLPHFYFQTSYFSVDVSLNNLLWNQKSVFFPDSHPFMSAACDNPSLYDVKNSVKGMAAWLLHSVHFFYNFRILDTVSVSAGFQAA